MKREKNLVDEKGKKILSTKREKNLVDETNLIKRVSTKREDTALYIIFILVIFINYTFSVPISFSLIDYFDPLSALTRL